MSVMSKIARAKQIAMSGLRTHGLAQLMIRAEYREVVNELRSVTPDNPALHGRKVYSQNDEDGIIEYIASIIGIEAGTFIEIGCADGLENNTHYLALKGWKGMWVDGSSKNVDYIKSNLPHNEKRLLVRERFVDREMSAELCNEFKTIFGSLDFLSVDIDGNDLAVTLSCLSVVSPKMICIEYNPKFPPPLVCEVAYNASHTWAQDDYHGASLQAIVNALTQYKLVACNVCGANAFLVRYDFADHFADHMPTALYQQARHYLVPYIDGHKPSLRFLAQVLATLDA